MAGYSNKRLRRRFWVETPLAALTGVLFVLTLIRPDWIAAFGIEPDHPSGLVEWLIVGVLAVCCVSLSIAVRAEWRRSAAAR